MFNHESSWTLERNIYTLSSLPAAAVKNATLATTTSHLEKLAKRLCAAVRHPSELISHAELLRQGKALRSTRLEGVEDTATTAASLRRSESEIRRCQSVESATSTNVYAGTISLMDAALRSFSTVAGAPPAA